MNDYIIRATAANGMILAYAATTTQLVEEARQIHQCSPTVTAALGRLFTIGGMMGIGLKGDNDKISIQVNGDGPVGHMMVVADGKGNVKGYPLHPEADAPPKYPGKLDVGKVVGENGRLTVIKDLGLKEPFVGQAELVSGEIAEDLSYYFAQSEQIPCVVAAGVLIERDLSVKASGGYILQLLPGAAEEVIEVLEERVQNLPPLTQLLTEGKTPEQILQMILEGYELNVLQKQSLQLRCECSRERMEKALIALGEKELNAIIAEDGQAELVCHFCNTVHRFNRVELETLLAEAQGK